MWPVRVGPPTWIPRKFFAVGDLPLLAELAHRLKGTAGAYGLLPIARTAQLVEQQADEERDLQQLQASVSELIGLCKQAAGGQGEKSLNTTRQDHHA